MKRHRITPALFFILAAAIVGGLLYRDGAFSSSWKVEAPATGASARMTDFGPPTRLIVDVDPSGVKRRKVLAEPVYVDVRVPAFFDEIDVSLRLWEATKIEEQIQIGFELGRNSGTYQFDETQIEAIPALGEGMLPTTAYATLSLAGIPHEDNRFRIVISLPGVDADHPVRIDAFTVTARRSGNWKNMLSRFFRF